MAHKAECPKCGEDISDSYQNAEPDVGIMSSGWYCDKCDEPVEDDGDYDPADFIDWDRYLDKQD